MDEQVLVTFTKIHQYTTLLAFQERDNEMNRLLRDKDAEIAMLRQQMLLGAGGDGQVLNVPDQRREEPDKWQEVPDQWQEVMDQGQEVPNQRQEEPGQPQEEPGQRQEEPGQRPPGGRRGPKRKSWGDLEHRQKKRETSEISRQLEALAEERNTEPHQVAAYLIHR